jgi:hypothetical protein
VHNDGSYTNRHGIPQRLTRACASRIRLAAKAIIARRSGVVPAIFAAAGEKAMRRFLEFFAVTIDNKNTRNAYLHACRRFFAWYDRHEDVEQLADIEPMHVAAYIQRRRAAKDRKRRRQNPVEQLANLSGLSGARVEAGEIPSIMRRAAMTTSRTLLQACVASKREQIVSGPLK